jgi:hypothetical protein
MLKLKNKNGPQKIKFMQDVKFGNQLVAVKKATWESFKKSNTNTLGGGEEIIRQKIVVI